ncbi:hypothetical protein [Rhodoblastus sp.]|uniref:hypothetical protein n=1 Tax=Rhodoblastus sp. TaxID=1962975 RepID=UPI0035B3BEEC
MRKIVLILGFAPTVAMFAALALWRFWPAPPPAEALTFDLAGQRLRFASAYVRLPDTIEPDRIDLVVRAPDFAPAAATPARLPATGEADDRGRAQIFLTLAPAPKAAPAAPAERYGPYLAPDVQVAEGGLLRRRFEDNSPYAGEDLYLAPPDGEDFFARCQRPKIPADGLPESCLAEFRIDRLLLQMRFDPAWLGDWAKLHANALNLIRGAEADGVRQPGNG